MHKMALDGSFIYPWLDYVRRSLDDLGLSYFWLYQERLDIAGLKRFKRTIKIRIFGQFRSTWYEGMFSSSICTNYRVFKLEYKMEPFLSVLPKNPALKMIKNRCRNTRLPVVEDNYDTGSLDNVYCTRCEKRSICDELLGVLESESFSNERLLYLGRRKFNTIYTRMFSEVLTSCNPKKLYNLTRFMSVIMSAFK